MVFSSGTAVAMYFLGSSIMQPETTFASDVPMPARPALSAAVQEYAPKPLIRTTAKIAALDPVHVWPSIDGRIISVTADVNEFVEKGDELARIDSDTLMLELRVLRARLTASRLQTKRSELEVDMLRKLAEMNASRIASLTARRSATVSDLELAQSELKRATQLGDLVRESERRKLAVNVAKLEAAIQEIDAQVATERLDGEAAKLNAIAGTIDAETNRANVEELEIQLEGIEDEIEKSIIRAPASGWIMKRDVEEGQIVWGERENNILFTLVPDIKKIRIIAAVNEIDVLKVQSAAAILFAADSLPARRLQAELLSVSPFAADHNSIVLYDAELVATNPDGALLPGMSAIVDFYEFPLLSNGLFVPQLAVFRQEDGHFIVVQDNADQENKIVPVKWVGNFGGSSVIQSPDVQPGDIALMIAQSEFESLLRKNM
ncbi:efflux RND transporter periplasmic adaptor subunit [Phaeobacter sp. B1627]|uniref:efflux RND transporter periplasmic adaptor subunit n=1 Tax=Phaeobacter sp. B1627 TaxID=2583809 RepID=UPI0011190A95|nr:HlyD family efflux transporter periplasmic adaptor subunit [Phaeobacter sp. B1627]TNJ40806.1 HlyD family efflux transporter periplasmic adaptor subunit [Phaeobacter sp. B1627]